MSVPLANCALFDGLPAEAVAELHTLGVRRRVLAGATLFQEGGAATTLYVLLDGRARVTRAGAGGGRVVLHYVHSGGVLGCAIPGGARTYPGTAEVVKDAVVLAFGPVAVDTLVSRHPLVAKNALHLLSARVEELRMRLRELSQERLEVRLAHALLRLRADADGADGAPALQVSRQELADLVGASMFSVSRLLADWERRAWIATGRQRVAVRDPNALAGLAFPG